MTISRTEILHRAVTLWGGLGSTPYSQNEWRDGYRTDCSGYVSGCWNLNAPEYAGRYTNLNTVTLVTLGVMEPISPDALQPGDAMGNCGPGTEGDAGHIVLFDRWDNNIPSDNHYWCYEQVGGQSGPVHSHYDWPYPGESNWQAYRFLGVSTTPATRKEEPMLFIRRKGFKAVWASNLITRSWISTGGGLTRAQDAAKSVYGLSDDAVKVLDVDELDGYGAAVGPLPPDEPSA